METLKFDGTVKIKLDVKEATDRILLHSKELSISKVSVDSGATLKSQHLLLKDNLLTLVFEDVIPAGERTLTIEFQGIHNDQMAGFYRSRYKNIKGEQKIMLSTQFEALDARRCFPCVDEPAAKASFKCTLVCKSGLQALSNMPVERQSQEKNGELIRFIHDNTCHVHVSSCFVWRVRFRLSDHKAWCIDQVFTPGRSEQGRFALDVAVRTLDLYDDFVFPILYPNSIDCYMEFAAGAMRIRLLRTSS